jgi:hypothetical protein
MVFLLPDADGSDAIRIVFSYLRQRKDNIIQKRYL